MPLNFLHSGSVNATSTNKKNQRIDSLDWLRGLMALSVMIYHLTGWFFFHPDASSFLGRMGVYGVSIFFILSGLSMSIVYNHFIKSPSTAIAFIIRRIFRIWPLLWIATFATILLAKKTAIPPDVIKIILNITGLFGFTPSNASIATGSWSIGNEMVYYALTPLIFWIYNKKVWLGNLFTLFTFAVCLYFAFVLLHVNDTLASQWMIYINPFNNLFLYTVGVAIFYNLRAREISQYVNYLIIIASLLIFVFYPIADNQIHIVTGFNRIVFILASIGAVVGFYKFSSSVPQVISFPLEKLGLMTYGVYILHPIVKSFVVWFFYPLHFSTNWGFMLLSILFTLIVSYLSYYIFEVPLMKVGKQISDKYMSSKFLNR